MWCRRASGAGTRRLRGRVRRGQRRRTAAGRAVRRPPDLAIGFVVGFAMFGALTFLPIFLQVVHGISPTLSGLHLLPMMAGLLVTSVLSGRLITRTGRYKIYPILGTAVTSTGLFLLSRMDEHTSTLVTSCYFCVLGLGLGLVMQVLVIAVQNAVGYEDL